MNFSVTKALLVSLCIATALARSAAAQGSARDALKSRTFRCGFNKAAVLDLNAADARFELVSDSVELALDVAADSKSGRLIGVLGAADVGVFRQTAAVTAVEYTNIGTAHVLTIFSRWGKPGLLQAYYVRTVSPIGEAPPIVSLVAGSCRPLK